MLANGVPQRIRRGLHRHLHIEMALGVSSFAVLSLLAVFLPAALSTEAGAPAFCGAGTGLVEVAELTAMSVFQAGGVPEPQWSPRQESNLYLALRRHSFYPLNYEGERGL